MRFMQILLVAVLVSFPVGVTSFAQGKSGGRAVASEKAKKAKAKKTVKAKKAPKAKKDVAAKAGAKSKDKKAKRAAKKAGKKAKKVAVAKKPRSHAPKHSALPNDEGAADPAQNFEVSPELQDDLPEPNNGALTD